MIYSYSFRHSLFLLMIPLLLGTTAPSAEMPKDESSQINPQPNTQPGAVSAGVAGKILILEGQGVHNSISSKAAISPVIQLLTLDGRPIPNADVVFQAPATGPGGQFGMAPIAATKTDRVGQATARFTPNTLPGRFAIQVKAKWNGGAADAAIVQFNDANLSEPVMQLAKRPWYKDWRVWAAAGGAAGVSTWLVQRNGSGGQVITIIPSPVGIGGGR